MRVRTVFANDGFRVPARVINAVTDQNQRKLKRYAVADPVMKAWLKANKTLQIRE